MFSVASDTLRMGKTLVIPRWLHNRTSAVHDGMKPQDNGRKALKWAFTDIENPLTLNVIAWTGYYFSNELEIYTYSTISAMSKSWSMTPRCPSTYELPKLYHLLRVLLTFILLTGAVCSIYRSIIVWHTLYTHRKSYILWSRTFVSVRGCNTNRVFFFPV